MMKLVASCRFLDTAIILLLASAFYAYVLLFAYSDFPMHIALVEQINSGISEYPPNFAFYFLINSIYHCTRGFISLGYAAVLVLSVATAAKYAICKTIIFDSLKKFSGNRSVVSVLLAVSLLFIFPLLDPYSIFYLKTMYLGKISPVVWHNSTSILLLPLALLLFWFQSRLFISIALPARTDVIRIFLLILANVAVKPSFILAYIPSTIIYGFYYLFKRRSLRVVSTICFAPSLFAGVLVFAQKYAIYSLQLGSLQEETSGVSLGFPFQVFTIHVPPWYIPLGLFLSFAFPLCVMAFKPHILKSTGFFYSLVLIVVSILVSSLLIETGPRLAHGNFVWTAHISSFILYFSAINYLSQSDFKMPARGFFDTTILILFFGHVISGIAYITKYILTGSYA